MDIVEFGEFFPTTNTRLRMIDCGMVDTDWAVNAHQALALRMAVGLGLDLVQIGEIGEVPPVVLLTLGSGIMMAAADHLRREYPWLPLLVADLSGSLGFEKRCVLLDYLGTAFPSVWALWSSIRDATEYLDFLKGRAFRPSRLYLYLQGLGAEDSHEWERLGNVVLLDGLFGPEPLGGGERLRQALANSEAGACVG